MKKARPYQEKMINEIYKKWSKGKNKVLAVAFTGWGKGFLVATVAQQMANHYKIVIVVRTRKLVIQLSEELDEAGIDHAVNMAGDSRLNPFKQIQVCSIDTLRARMNFPHIEHKKVLIIADEAHMSKSASFQDLFNAYDKPLILGVTATPFNGLSHFDAYVETIKPHELVEQGFLVPFKIFAPKLIETNEIKIGRESGEFDQKELYKAASKKEIVGRFVQCWKKFGQGRPTLLFAVNIEHSKQIAKTFNNAGIAAVHIDADSSDEARAQAEKDLVSGKIKVVTNVALWTTGVNIPAIACIQDCAPTKSENKFIQKWGRGTRTNDGKTDCIIIDNAGNVNEHGSPYAPRSISLDCFDKKLSKKGIVEKMQTCSDCFRAFTPGPKQCPYCHSTRDVKQPRISEVDKELTYLSDEDFAYIERLKLLKSIAMRKEKFGNVIRQVNWKCQHHSYTRNKTPAQKEEFLWKELINKFGLPFCKEQNIIPLPERILKIHEFDAKKQLQILNVL